MHSPMREEMFFFPGSHGRRLLACLHHGAGGGPTWLYLPAFAEERQMTHAIAVETARALAAHGFPVLRFDFSGCGDSDGELDEVSWDDWLVDAQCALAELQRRSGVNRFVFWGMRTGCSMALDLVTANKKGSPLFASDPLCAGLALWQPVLDTELFLNQFLRQKLATALAGGTTQGITVKTLLAEMAAGKMVEVAGYPIRQTLAASMVMQKRRALIADPTIPVRLFSVGNGDVSPVLQNAVATANAAGGNASIETVATEPFWERYWRFRSPEMAAVTVAFAQEIAP